VTLEGEARVTSRRAVLEAELERALDWTHVNVQSAEQWCDPDRFGRFETQMHRGTGVALELACLVSGQACNE
jgi:hypothetical protein